MERWTAYAAASALAACGDGEGGSGPEPLDPDAAVALTGSAPPVEAVADQAARAAAISDRIDSLILSTLYGEIEGEDFILATNCRGTRCTLTAPRTRRSITITLEDLRNTESEDGRSLAVLTKNGVTLIEERGGAGGADSRDYGGWLDHSAFQLEAGIAVTADSGQTLTARGASAAGDLTGSRPAASAKWRGLMVGTPARGDRREGVLQGDAELNYRFGSRTLAADFTGIVDLDRNAPHTVSEVRFPSVPVAADGTYGAGGVGNRIQGGFAGPDHAETAGIFERRGIVGAFGAKRR
ncbi:MAG: hypothetical protein OXC62_01315 [Aestuariivita sp.]|nr:hypothetical protein [Aestuariivita sp.]